MLLNKKLLFISAIMLCSFQSFGINNQLLDINVATCVGKIRNSSTVVPEDIESHLEFLYYTDKRKTEKYASELNFTRQYDYLNDQLSLKSFQEFTANCKKIYGEYDGIEPVVQAAVHILMKKVGQRLIDEKSLTDFTSLDKIIALKPEDEQHQDSYDFTVSKKQKTNFQSCAVTYTSSNSIDVH